jgi:hypothetical protein
MKKAMFLRGASALTLVFCGAAGAAHAQTRPPADHGTDHGRGSHRHRLVHRGHARGRLAAGRRDRRRGPAEAGLALDGGDAQGPAGLERRAGRHQPVRQPGPGLGRLGLGQPARPGLAAHPGADERPAPGDQPAGRGRGGHRRHQHHSGRRHRPDRGAEGRGGGDLRLGRHRRRRQLHHQEELQRPGGRGRLSVHRRLEGRLRGQRHLRQGLGQRQHPGQPSAGSIARSWAWPTATGPTSPISTTPRPAGRRRAIPRPSSRGGLDDRLSRSQLHQPGRLCRLQRPDPGLLLALHAVRQPGREAGRHPGLWRGQRRPVGQDQVPHGGPLQPHRRSRLEHLAVLRRPGGADGRGRRPAVPDRSLLSCRPTTPA